MKRHLFVVTSTIKTGGLVDKLVNKIVCYPDEIEDFIDPAGSKIETEDEDYTKGYYIVLETMVEDKGVVKDGNY